MASFGMLNPWNAGFVCHTGAMAIDDSTPENGEASRPAFQVIEGGRAQLERSALDAVFSDPQELDALLRQLSRPAVQLGLVCPDEPRASHGPTFPGQ